jgi:hypothetical protein
VSPQETRFVGFITALEACVKVGARVAAASVTFTFIVGLASSSGVRASYGKDGVEPASKFHRSRLGAFGYPVALTTISS